MNIITQFNKGKALLSALIFIGFIISIGHVRAGVLITTRPGTECVEHRDTNSEILYTGGNASSNSNILDVYVCPASLHYLQTKNDGFFFEVGSWWVTVNDRNPNSNFQCFARSCSSTGEMCTNSPSAFSSGTELDSLGLVELPSGSYTGYLYIRCSIPRKFGEIRSSIISYTTLLAGLETSANISQSLIEAEPLATPELLKVREEWATGVLLDHLEEAIAISPIDDQWGEGYKEAIENYMTSSDIKSSNIDEVRCSQSLCRITINHEDVGDVDLLADAIGSGPLSGESFFIQPNEARQTTVYIARQGHKPEFGRILRVASERLQP